MASTRENQSPSEMVTFAMFSATALSVGVDIMYNVVNYWRRAVQAVRDDPYLPNWNDVKDLTLTRGDLYDKVLRVTHDDHEWRMLQYVTVALVNSLLPPKGLVSINGQMYRYQEHDWKIDSIQHPYGEPSVVIYACQRNGCLSAYDSRKVHTREAQIPQGCKGL